MIASLPPPPDAITIGASAGAVDALGAILPSLPADFHPPIFIVVHLRPDCDSALPEIFQKRCALSVREAQDKDPIKPSTIYFAPPDYHLLVEKNGVLSLSNEEPELFSRPSIDVLFQTAADAYGKRLLALVLTGANEDGARGVKAISRAGGRTIAQSPSTALAPTMPQAALDASSSTIELSLGEIVSYLMTFSKK